MIKKIFSTIICGLFLLSNTATGTNKVSFPINEEDRHTHNTFRTEIRILEILRHTTLIDTYQPSLNLALREYQIFHFPQERAWRTTQLCDDFNVIERKDLWNLDNTPREKVCIDNLGTLSFDGEFFIVFNPTSGYLECHHIDSQELLWRKHLNINSRKGEKFDIIDSITQDYITYSTTSKITTNETQVGNTTYQSTYSKERLYLLNLLDPQKTTELSDDLFTHYNIAHIQRSGWDIFDKTDDNGNIYLFSSSPRSKLEINFHTDLSPQPTHV